MKDEKINQPSHYAGTQIETIKYIEDKLSVSGFEGYCVGNIIKYVSRYRFKGGIDDLKKAAWYLKRLIKTMEKQ
jgi:hypothetical protein